MKNNTSDKTKFNTIHCGEYIMGFIPSCDSKKIVQTNCKNCGANDFKNNQCTYCNTRY